MRDLKEISKRFHEKLKKIKVVLLDVDGILTDASITYFGEEVKFNRTYNALDGYGIRVLIESGMKVGVVTGGVSVSLKKRAATLGLSYLYEGKEDKREAFLEVMKDAKVSGEEICYMGDELFDMPLLKKAGFSATVPHAVREVHEVVDYVTEKEAGKGAVREVIDLIRYSQNIIPVIPQFDD